MLCGATMPDLIVLTAIAAVGAVSFLMRIGGFLAATGLAPDSTLARIIKLAPGNLLVAFVAAGVLEGGWPSLAGAFFAAGIMALTRKEWAGLSAGFAAAALTAALI